MQQESKQKKLKCIDSAIEWIKENDYKKLLLDIHKFIDTKLENSIKNMALAQIRRKYLRIF